MQSSICDVGERAERAHCKSIRMIKRTKDKRRSFSISVCGVNLNTLRPHMNSLNFSAFILKVTYF